ncbi:hypothetical protein F5B21DRAFT_445892 [Xylaria acuta]|nr:hypothetical protein F5B21DRAFT_445892 [Xylaria acuta]
MCVKSYLHFTKCSHIETSLTTCPTHHKQQESARGLFGCIFWQSARKKKDCGKVFPHHLESETYCEGCSVRKGHFRAQGVGHGALKARKQGFQEISHEESKEAARLALQKAGKYRRRGGKLNHEILHSQTSVWLTDLYRHPETLARKEAYARGAARAPPVSSRHQTESRPRVLDPSPRARAQGRHAGESRQTEDSREWMPAYGYSQPMARPAQPAPTHQTHQCSGRFTNHAPSLPPSVVHSPHMPRDNRSFAARTQATGRPDLRPKTGHIHNTARGRIEQPVTPRQACMNGEVKTRAASQAKQQPSTPREIVHWGPRPYWERNPSRWETRKAAFSNWIETKTGERTSKPVDEDSDISFVCQTSKAISDQQPARSTRRSHRQSTGSGWSGGRH